MYGADNGGFNFYYPLLFPFPFIKIFGYNITTPHFFAQWSEKSNHVSAEQGQKMEVIIWGHVKNVMSYRPEFFKSAFIYIKKKALLFIFSCYSAKREHSVNNCQGLRVIYSISSLSARNSISERDN